MFRRNPKPAKPVAAVVAPAPVVEAPRLSEERRSAVRAILAANNLRDYFKMAYAAVEAIDAGEPGRMIGFPDGAYLPAERLIVTMKLEPVVASGPSA